jgi:hypothetical protein
LFIVYDHDHVTASENGSSAFSRVAISNGISSCDHVTCHVTGSLISSCGLYPCLDHDHGHDLGLWNGNGTWIGSWNGTLVISSLSCVVTVNDPLTYSESERNVSYDSFPSSETLVSEISTETIVCASHFYDLWSDFCCGFDCEICAWCLSFDRFCPCYRSPW